MTRGSSCDCVTGATAVRRRSAPTAGRRGHGDQKPCVTTKLAAVGVPRLMPIATPMSIELIVRGDLWCATVRGLLAGAEFVSSLRPRLERLPVRPAREQEHRQHHDARPVARHRRCRHRGGNRLSRRDDGGVLVVRRTPGAGAAHPLSGSAGATGARGVAAGDTSGTSGTAGPRCRRRDGRPALRRGSPARIGRTNTTCPAGSGRSEVHANAPNDPRSTARSLAWQQLTIHPTATDGCST